MKASMNDVWGPITAEIRDLSDDDRIPYDERLYAINFELEHDEMTLYMHDLQKVRDLIKGLYDESERLQLELEGQA